MAPFRRGVFLLLCSATVTNAFAPRMPFHHPKKSLTSSVVVQESPTTTSAIDKRSNERVSSFISEDDAREIVDRKTNKIRKACALVNGEYLESFYTAEYYDADRDSWVDDPTQPICLYFSNNKVLSVAWEKKDLLNVSNELPLSATGLRWKKDGVESLREAIGSGPVGGSYLGLGVKSHDPKAMTLEIWMSVFLDLGQDRWLEISTASSNQYIFYEGKPKDVELFQCA